MAAFNAQMSAFYYEERRPSIYNAANTGEDDIGVCGCFHFKSSSKNMNNIQKDRIKQFSIWQSEVEESRGREYIRRRRRRKRKRKSFQNHPKVKKIRLCYVIVFLLFITGSLFTMCSLVKTFGANTPFYKHRDLFRIIGPIILLLSAIAFFFVDAMAAYYKKSLERDDNGYYIARKKVLKNGKTQTTVEFVKPGNSPSSVLPSSSEVTDETTPSSGNIKHTFVTLAEQEKNPNLPSAKAKRWRKVPWMHLSEESACSDFTTTTDGTPSSPVTTANDNMWSPSSYCSESFTFENHLSRNSSSKSKSSTTSQFSTSSESAPLVRKT